MVRYDHHTSAESISGLETASIPVVVKDVVPAVLLEASDVNGPYGICAVNAEGTRPDPDNRSMLFVCFKKSKVLVSVLPGK